MHAWLESVAPGYGSALIWTLAALIGLLILLVVIRIVRSLTFGTFVAGGRSRKTRLAVMDATAVDSHRRLVLVRRDDVEHLLLIGGPTDVVVEQNIRLIAAGRRQAPPRDFAEPANSVAGGHQLTASAPPAPAQPTVPPKAISAHAPVAQAKPIPAGLPEIAVKPGPGAPRAAERSAISQPPAAAPRPPVPTSISPAKPASASAPSMPTRPPYSPSTYTPAPSQAAGGAAALQPAAPAPQSAAPSPTSLGAGKSSSLDDNLLQELEVSLEREARKTWTPAPTASPAAPATSAERERAIDDELTQLLGDLTTPKR